MRNPLPTHPTLCLLLATALAACNGSAPPPSPSELTPRPEAGAARSDPPVSHALLDGLLGEFVREDGGVDYEGLLASRERLDRYLALLEGVAPEALTRSARPDQMAFWINAYNAWTLRAVLDAWPLERRGLGGLRFPARSIRQIPDVWTRKRPVARGRYSLDDMEHAVLRRLFRDPRIHFAVNCASVSCPPLRAEAYRGDRLDQQLDQQARRFLADPTRNRIDPEAKVVELSRIFEWFGQDFGGVDAFERNGAAPEAMWATVRPWLAEDLQEFAKDFPPGSVEYLSYDWSLND